LQEAAKENKDGRGKAGNREEIIQIRGAGWKQGRICIQIRGQPNKEQQTNAVNKTKSP
jgi:hypothetical protein